MIALKGVQKTLGDMKILEDLTFSIETGRVLCIVGPSGSGKTTTLQILAGLQKPDQGTISGQEGMQVSYVFQEHRLLPWKTVEENMHFVLKGQLVKQERESIIDQYLEIMALSAYRKYYPKALSGGMKQRLALCRAFAFPHDLLLMDEPFKSLDTPLRLNLVGLVAKMWESKQNTIVFVTHDIAEALLLGHKIIVYSAKPASVRSVFDIDIPHQQRDISSPVLAQIYKEVNLLLANEYT